MAIEYFHISESDHDMLEQIMDLEQEIHRRLLQDALNRFLREQSKENRCIFLRRYWYGDSVGDFSPLSRLTVTEVKEMGRVLGLPEDLVEKVPIDGLSGKTDEDNLGFTYETLDRYIREGIEPTPEKKAAIDRKHAISRFKFQTIPVYHNGLPMVIEDGTDYYTYGTK